MLDDFADKLSEYQRRETIWLSSPGGFRLWTNQLVPAKAALDISWNALAASTNFPAATLTNLSSRYKSLAETAISASASTLRGPVNSFLIQLPDADKRHGLFSQVESKLNELGGQAAETVNQSLNSRQVAIAAADAGCLAPNSTNNPEFAYLTRWRMYADACTLDARVGFPVLLDSKRTMSPEELHGARSLAGTLYTSLQNPAWQSYPVVAVFRKNRDAYDSVISGLANEEGNPSSWELWFVPPEKGTPSMNDYTILTIFPYLEFKAGGNTAKSDNLTRTTEPVRLGKFTADQGLAISFDRFATESTSRVSMPQQTNWAMVRLIQSYKASRQDDGKSWRFHVPVQDAKNSGNFTFEIRLANAGKGLPKIEDWPTQLQ